MRGERNDVRRALVKATETTFADMAFIDATEVIDYPGESDTGQLIHIDLTHPLDGWITLYLSTPLKQRVVENIFGLCWEEIGSGKIDDCLLELLNVLAGSFLKELGVSEEKHSISLPQLLFDDLEIEGHAEFAHYYFDAEGNPFHLSVSYGEKDEI